MTGVDFPSVTVTENESVPVSPTSSASIEAVFLMKAYAPLAVVTVSVP